MKKILISTSALLSLTYASIGTVTAIRGDVNITRGVALYQAHKNLSIEEKDTFFTGARGSMQITFADKTVITLGKNTVFKVDEYLYSEKKRQAKAKFKFRKGFFKSITGRIGKMAPKQFSIKTKNSTIGVRGTEIIGNSTNKKEDIICTNGAISVKTGKKTVIAKKDEKVEIKLNPKIEYKIASPIDVMVQEQVKAGIKKASDPEVKKRPKADMTIEYKPEVKKELKAKGINPNTIKIEPVVAITAPKPITVAEIKKVEKIGFNKDKKSFKDDKELRKEVQEFNKEGYKEVLKKEIEAEKKKKVQTKQPKKKKVLTKKQHYTFKPIKPEVIKKEYLPKLKKSIGQRSFEALNHTSRLMQRYNLENIMPQRLNRIMQGLNP